MSSVGTAGWEKGHPYAYGYETTKVAPLGTPIWPIFGRIKCLVDLDQARGEAVSIDVHRALELTLALFSTEFSRDWKHAFNSVAIACLVTDKYLPKEIQHPHPKILSDLGITQSYFDAHASDPYGKTHFALGWASEALETFPDSYVGENTHTLKQSLRKFESVLSRFGPDHLSRDIRIDPYGSITRVVSKHR